jgi:oxygen-independent coproporphyrinogen-3 oxidase
VEEIARLREAGIDNINVDLIAGLPHQTVESWAYSVSEAIATGVPHVSVYMLEVDDESRLGRELIAGGVRYHAHFVPDDDMIADFYQQACEMLSDASIEQYEISNFARADGLQSNQSRHNLKYWTRQPYLGFGVDAHSMLVADRHVADLRAESQNHAVRFAASDSLDAYMNRASHTTSPVSAQAAVEESFFLGLRLNRGIDLEQIREEFSGAFLEGESAVEQCVRDGLLEQYGDNVRLTARGRLLSNEVFARFLTEEKIKVGTGHVNPR